MFWFITSTPFLASDSFKRACFNWGIGRELYTSPFIWVSAEKCNIKETNRKDKNGKPVYTCNDNFIVEAIQITDKVITGLSIKNLSLKLDEIVTTQRVFVYKKGN